MRQVESQTSQWPSKAGLGIVLWLVLTCPASHAQIATTGIINGSVSDPSGAAIVAAKVSITNTATGAVSEGASNAIGRFSQVGLIPGQYEVTVAHAGFATFKEAGIRLESAAVYTVNVVLKVGTESSSVTVSASGVAVQTTTP